MLKMVGENLTAISYITVDGKDIRIVSLTGNIDYNAKTYSVNKSILNSELYLANKETCNKDYADFEDEIIKSLN